MIARLTPSQRFESKTRVGRHDLGSVILEAKSQDPVAQLKTMRCITANREGRKPNRNIAINVADFTECKRLGANYVLMVNDLSKINHITTVGVIDELLADKELLFNEFKVIEPAELGVSPWGDDVVSNNKPLIAAIERNKEAVKEILDPKPNGVAHVILTADNAALMKVFGPKLYNPRIDTLREAARELGYTQIQLTLIR